MISKRVVLAVTGASGMPYAVRLAQALAGTPSVEPHLIISRAAEKVLDIEGGSDLGEWTKGCIVHAPEDITAPPASGSWKHDGMIVCPCSMKTLATVANGYGEGLLHRAADVTLKEGRKLVLVPRETPLGIIHLENMLRAARAGAVILPACPGFYHGPDSMEALADFVAGKVLDQLDIPHELYKRWGT